MLTVTQAHAVEIDNSIQAHEPCVLGVAGGFPCNKIDLLAHIPLSQMGGGNGSDIWGWTDSNTGKEYAIVGRSTGTSFLDISDPESPIYLGDLPPAVGNSSWRDIKVYNDHAFIVTEASSSGMQVFDLAQLASVASPPVTFVANTTYTEFGNAHNLAIDENSGFAYAVGTNTCSGGLHTINIQIPDSPVSAGCVSEDGYTHDAQCVSYVGPDTDYTGAEICLNGNEDTLTIFDVTDKSTPIQIARVGYTNVGYTHQGWLTEDHRYFLLGDETDEISSGINTRTLIWDLIDIDAPVLIGEYESALLVSDHNQYVRGNFVYQSNYKAGLSILSIADIANGNLTEVASFDTFPSDNTAGTSGAWSVFPYYDSGIVTISDINNGLFIVQPNLCEAPQMPQSLVASSDGDNQIALNWNGVLQGADSYTVMRSFGNCPGQNYETIASGITQAQYLDTVSGSVDYAYVIQAQDGSGACISNVSNCDSSTTTGACNAPPSFSGIQSATNQGGSNCAIEIAWTAGQSRCNVPINYSVYRSVDAAFLPDTSNLLQSELNSTQYSDTSALSGQTYYYIVRTTDTGNGIEDTNQQRLMAKATGPLANGLFQTGAEINDVAMSFTETRHPNGWQISTERANTGIRSFFSSYSDNQCVQLVTPTLNLTDGMLSALSFSTAYDIEPNFDGGVVQISNDNGLLWQTLNLATGYPGTFNSTSDACGFDNGDLSFTGTNLTWSDHTADLSAFNGDSIQIRWIFSTDQAVTMEGWYIDDIAISNAQVPGSCSTNFIFDDGFES